MSATKSIHKMSHKNNYFNYENLLLMILFLAFGFVFFDRLALPFLFPFMSEELHLTNIHLGILSSALALTWSISGFLVGAWSDRTGKRKSLLIICVIVFSLSSALSGLAAGFISLLIIRAIMGIAEGPILPISQTLMLDASQPHRRGFNMGLLQGSSAGLFGAIIAPPIMIYLAQTIGWRYAFFVSIIPGLIISFLIFRYVRKDSPRTLITDQGIKSQETCKESSVDDLIDNSREKNITFWRALRERNILLCILISCFFVSWFIVLISFTPTFLVSYRDFEPSLMGTIISCMGIAWILWGAVTPAISDRIGRKPALIFFALVAACCPVALLYAESPFLLGVIMILTYTGLGCFTLFMATIPAETVPKHLVATVLGLIMGLGEFFGGCVAPIIAGYLADLYGLDTVMWIAFGCALIAAFFATFLIETAPIIVAKKKLR